MNGRTPRYRATSSPGSPERRRPLLVPSLPAPRKPDLEREQLVEGKPLPRLLALLLAPRTVERDERVGAAGQPLARLERGGQWIDHVACVVERLPDHIAQLLDGDLLARGVDGREIGRRGDAVHVIGANGELAALQVAAQPDPRAGLEPVLEPCLVEPDGGDLAGLVGDAGLHELEPPRSLDADAQDFAGDRRLLLAEQVGDRQLGRRGLVPAGPVLERVPDRPQPERREPFLDGRPDAVQCLEPELEPLGPRRAWEARPLRRRLCAGEAAQSGQAASGEGSSSGRNFTWSFSMRVPSTSITSNLSPFHDTSSPASGARPSWPKTKPASVW